MSMYYLYLFDLSQSVYMSIKFHAAQSVQLALPETHSLTDVFGYGLSFVAVRLGTTQTSTIHQ